MENEMGRSADMYRSSIDEHPSMPSDRGAGGQQQKGLKDQAVSQLQTLADQTMSATEERVRSAANTGKVTAVEALSGLAQSLQSTGRELKDKENGAAQVVEQVAEQLDRAAHYLESADVNDLVRRGEDWARENPFIFLGGAFLLGALGARFLRTSRPPQNRARIGSGAGQFSDREIHTSATVET